MLTARRSVLPTALLLPAVAVLPLAGCGSAASAPTPTATATAVAGSPSSAPASTSMPGAMSGAMSAPHGLTLRDAWAKAATGGTTAVFGTLVNPSDKEIRIVSGTSPSAGAVELHEVAMVDGTMQMRPKAGGFAVPAHGTHELRPGGDHVMLVRLTGPVRAGDEVKVTLTLDCRMILQVSAVAKDFAAGNESYRPSASSMAAR